MDYPVIDYHPIWRWDGGGRVMMLLVASRYRDHSLTLPHRSLSIHWTGPDFIFWLLDKSNIPVWCFHFCHMFLEAFKHYHLSPQAGCSLWLQDLFKYTEHTSGFYSQSQVKNSKVSDYRYWLLLCMLLGITSKVFKGGLITWENKNTWRNNRAEKVGSQ